MKKLLIISLLLSVVGVQAAQNDHASKGLEMLADVALNGQPQLEKNYMDLPPLIPLEEGGMVLSPFPTSLTEEERVEPNPIQMEQGDHEDLSDQAPGGKWKQHQCNVCDQNYSTNSSLTRHMRTHTGEKPYECKECGTRFTQSGNLTIHIRIHSGEKPYVCKECCRSFARLGNLQEHEKTHQKEMVYECQECPKIFFAKNNLSRHVREAHQGEKPFPCLRCGQGFCRKSTLKNHMNRKNPCVNRTQSFEAGAAEESDKEDVE